MVGAAHTHLRATAFRTANFDPRLEANGFPTTCSLNRSCQRQQQASSFARPASSMATTHPAAVTRANFGFIAISPTMRNCQPTCASHWFVNCAVHKTSKNSSSSRSEHLPWCQTPSVVSSNSVSRSTSSLDSCTSTNNSCPFQQ